jgi:hypothetical protein
MYFNRAFILNIILLIRRECSFSLPTHLPHHYPRTQWKEQALYVLNGLDPRQYWNKRKRTETIYPSNSSIVITTCCTLRNSLLLLYLGLVLTPPHSPQIHGKTFLATTYQQTPLGTDSWKGMIRLPIDPYTETNTLIPVKQYTNSTKR